MAVYNGVKNTAKYSLAHGMCLYRAEVRCKLKKAGSVLKKLLRYVKPENFSFYPSDLFFKILQSNIDSMTSIIKYGGQPESLSTITSHQSLVQSILAEYILKTLYLIGQNPISILPSHINSILYDSIANFVGSIDLVENIPNIIHHAYRSMTVEEWHSLVVGQVKIWVDWIHIKSCRLYYF